MFIHFNWHIFIFFIPFVTEKPLWGVANKVCMYVRMFRVSINILDRYPWLTLDQHSINTLVDTPLTLHLSQESTNFQSKLMSWYIRQTIDQLLIKCRSSVTEYQLGRRSSTNQDVDQGYWLRVSIDVRQSITDAVSTHDPITLNTVTS